MIKSRLNPASYLIVFFFLTWIVLFEFLLPVNNVLPKPTIALQSLHDLFRDYKLWWNYLTTLSTIYPSLIIAYYFIFILFPLILGSNFLSNLISAVDSLSRYIPQIILAMLLIIWFPSSNITPFIFSFLIAFVSLVSRSKSLVESLPSDYDDMIKTFGVKEKIISRKILWKAVQPKLIQYMIKLNIHLWVSLIIFEFINLRSGMGVILRQILQFKDLSAFWVYLFILVISIFISTQVINFIKRKFFFWEVQGR